MTNANQPSANTDNTSRTSAVLTSAARHTHAPSSAAGPTARAARTRPVRRFVVCRPADSTGALVTAAQLAAARRLLVSRAVAWLAISDRAEAQWMGTKTDLVEIIRYVYEAQYVRTPDGRPLSFRRLAVLFFAKLHTYFAPESFYCLHRQAMRRKGVCMPTMLWRFAWRMNADRAADPLAGLVRLLRDPSEGGAPAAPATPAALAAYVQGVD